MRQGLRKHFGVLTLGAVLSPGMHDILQQCKKVKTNGVSGKVGKGRMEMQKQSKEKAEGQRDFDEGFQALVWASHTACLLMSPSWTMLGKSLPDPSHLCLQR